jgi:outer membrane lipoprotein-sorting protein
MNDLHHPCEPWAERISLAAAGCLSCDEEREVDRHIEACPDCREHFRQLTQLCGALREAQSPSDDAAAAIVARVMSAVASGGSEHGPLSLWERARVRAARAETVHPTLLSRSLNNLRWIMRSPVSRVAAAVVLVIAITAVALWLHGGGATPAYADFIQPILEAKSVKYRMTYEMEGHIGMTSEVMVLAPDRTREESRQEMPGNLEMRLVTIRDPQKGKTLSLNPEHKTATVATWENMPKELASANWFSGMRSLLRAPGFKRKPLGEKAFEGQRAVGCRLSLGAGKSTMDLWSDPETGLLIHVEISEQRSGKAMKVTLSDFVFNVHLDESLFSLEPPAGYTMRNAQKDQSPAEKKLQGKFNGTLRTKANGEFKSEKRQQMSKEVSKQVSKEDKP